MSEELIDPDNPAKQSEMADEKEKAKGEKSKGKAKYGNHKLNIYLSDEDYKLYTEFIEEGWHDNNASG